MNTKKISGFNMDTMEVSVAVMIVSVSKQELDDDKGIISINLKKGIT